MLSPFSFKKCQVLLGSVQLALLFMSSSPSAFGADGNLASSVTDHHDRQHPVFFAIGGNDSCRRTVRNWAPGPQGSGLYKSLQDTLQKISHESDVVPEFFVACYNSGSLSLSYVSSWNPVVAYNRSEQEVRKEILEKRSLMDGNSAFLLGHSYGGWLTMSIMSQVTTDADFAAVYTIDPISKVFCDYIHPLACQGVPEDISWQERQHIADHSAAWHNFYQNRTFYMRSNSIFQATENHKILASHRDMETNPQVWDTIYQTSLQLL